MTAEQLCQYLDSEAESKSLRAVKAEGKPIMKGFSWTAIVDDFKNHCQAGLKADCRYLLRIFLKGDKDNPFGDEIEKCYSDFEEADKVAREFYRRDFVRLTMVDRIEKNCEPYGIVVYCRVRD